MVQPPVEQSKFHLVLKELGKVTTKGGVASLTIGLLFLFGIFAMFLLTGADRIGIVSGILVLMVGFSVYAFSQLKQYQDDDAESTSDKRAKLREKHKSD